jgi:hypothetical protein
MLLGAVSHVTFGNSLPCVFLSLKNTLKKDRFSRYLIDGTGGFA